MKSRITQSTHIELVRGARVTAKTAVSPWQLSLELLAAFTIVCMLTLVVTADASAGPAAGSPMESPFLHDDNEFFTGKKGIKGNWLTDKTRSLDNHELLQTANNLRINDMSAGQRVHNYYWIQGSDSKLTSSKSVSKYLLQSFAKAYWNQLRATEFKELSIIPDADGAGSFAINRTELDYKLRLSADRVKLMVKMDF